MVNGLDSKYNDLLESVINNRGEINSKYEAFVNQTIIFCSDDNNIFDIYRKLKEIEADLTLRLEGREGVLHHVLCKRLRSFIATEIEIILFKLHQPELIALCKEGAPYPSLLHWTDDKVSLVEMMYSIRKSINHGKASMKKITSCFEFMFQIKLGNVYDIFSEINDRKSNVTRYLDTLPGNLIKELDRLNK